MCIVFVCTVHFKAKSDTGPSKKKKKCKKKDEATDGKTPKPQQMPSPSPAAQKIKAAVKPNGSKTEAANGAAHQKHQGIPSLRWSCVEVFLFT